MKFSPQCGAPLAQGISGSSGVLYGVSGDPKPHVESGPKVVAVGTPARKRVDQRSFDPGVPMKLLALDTI